MPRGGGLCGGLVGVTGGVERDVVSCALLLEILDGPRLGQTRQPHGHDLRLKKQKDVCGVALQGFHCSVRCIHFFRNNNKNVR